MNPANEWEHLNKATDDDLVKLLHADLLSKHSPKEPVSQIRKNLLIHGGWAILISIAYALILIWVDVVLIRISIAVVLVFNLGAVVGSWLLYKRLSATQHAQSVLANMEQQYSMLKAWQELYLRLSLLLYPISAAAGFLLGLHIAARDPLEMVLQKKAVWISMIVAIIAITPVGHWLGKKLTIMAFGKHIQRLKENIDEWKRME